MQEKSDVQLLREYAGHGYDAAFRDIVVRHTNLVYSAALRQVESSDLAADIAQSVFVDLARKAKPLSERFSTESSLIGWLHRSTRYAALNHLRDTRRRLANERQAMEQLLTNSESSVDWEQIRPTLDEALDSLGDEDREAMLLRFFKGQDFRAVGLALGVSDDAAQKRVSRAIERLREFFAKRGVTVGASALAAALSANAVQAAPVGLAATISTAATLAANVVSTSTAIATTKTIAMTTASKALIAATIVAAIGTGIYEVRQNSRLHEQNQMLLQQQDSLTDQNRQLQKELDQTTSTLAAARLAPGQSPNNATELARLRGEVTRLRQDARELAQWKAATAATGSDPAIEATLKSWAARAAQLKQRLEQMPDKRIPELQLLTDKDWFDAIKNAKQLETDADFRQAFNNLRNSAKQAFGNAAREALKRSAEANNGMLPGDLSQLKPYFEMPVDDAILERYSLLQTGKLADAPQNEYLLDEKAPPVDDEYDAHYEFSMNGTRSRSINDPGDVVMEGLKQFAKAHNGNLPANASQLAPYLQRPLDQTKVQEMLSSLPPGITTMEQLKAAGAK